LRRRGDDNLVGGGESHFVYTLGAEIGATTTYWWHGGAERQQGAWCGIKVWLALSFVDAFFYTMPCHECIVKLKNKIKTYLVLVLVLAIGVVYSLCFLIYLCSFCSLLFSLPSFLFFSSQFSFQIKTIRHPPFSLSKYLFYYYFFQKSRWFRAVIPL